LYDEESGELVLESVYPPDVHPALVQRIKERRSLDPKISSGPIGVTGLAVLRGESYLIDDVEQQPEYVVYDANTKSELAVPLRSGNKVIGVINVESDRLGAFDKDDCKALEAFSDMAVIAIENARGYALLTQTKGLVGARTALAWMGMMSSHWRHNIDRWALTILNQVRNTRDHSAFKAGVPEWLEMKLRIFEEQAAKIKAAPTVPTLSAEDTELINLSDFVGERLKVLWNDEHIYKAAKLQAVPDLNVSASVLVSSDWLSKLLYILIDNSFDAVKTLPADRRWIGVETRLADGGIELIISDGGGGIPDEIFEQLLKKPVEQTRADSQSKKGMGMGLLMADAIVEAYAGRLRVGKTGPEGTSMVIWLPTTN
jgi:signal transduction histidine kinase